MFLQEEWEDDDADETADFAAPDASLADVMSNFAPASDFGGFGDYVDDDDEEDDPDALQDPLYHIQLQVSEQEPGSTTYSCRLVNRTPPLPHTAAG